MPTGAVTVTGYAGPGMTVTAVVINNVTKFEVDIDKGMLRMTDTSGNLKEVAISAATTFTVTISGGNYTVTIS
jgi:hypothetical protein